MTRITFLAHSGFLVELPQAALLFDWWKGELPSLPTDRPLTVFASHRHPDHFDPRIFSLDDGARDVAFLLSKDIRLSPRRLEKWGVPEETAKKIRPVDFGEAFSLPARGIGVETLRSTDEGVAFLVTAGEKTVYHAGDLNWWHWDGEDEGWNRNMEVNFKRYLEPLRGRKLDLAFAPLDPRLGRESGWGFRWLLETAEVERVFPMHQWEDSRPTARFCAEFPTLAPKIVPVDHLGQSWEFPD